jgi:peptide/nickel transport system permease protein
MERLATYVHDPATLKSAQSIERLIDKYHLDDPFPLSYINWINRVVHLDLGWSQVANQSVWEAICQRFPATLELVLYSIIPVILVGIWLGVISAVHHNDMLDQTIRVTAIIGWSLPTFILWNIGMVTPG